MDIWLREYYQILLQCQIKATVLKSDCEEKSLSQSCAKIMCILRPHVVLQAQTIWKKMETNMHKIEPPDGWTHSQAKCQEWEMSWRNTWIIVMLYLCFCFPVFTKWHNCSSGTHTEKHAGPSAPNETRQSAQRCFFSRAHYRRSSFSLLSSFSCVFVSLPLFIFTTACTFWASRLLFAWLRFFSLCFACSSQYSFKGEHSLEVNHAPQTQTIYDCVKGHLCLLSFWIPVFFFGNFCLESFSVFIHFHTYTIWGLFAET